LKNKNAMLIVNIKEAQSHKLLAIKDKFSQLRERIILQNVSKIIKHVNFDNKFECITYNFFAS